MDLPCDGGVFYPPYSTPPPPCSEESRALGFVVLLDAEIIHDFFMKTLVKALTIIQVGGYFSYPSVYIIISLDIIEVVTELSKYTTVYVIVGRELFHTGLNPAIKFILRICVNCDIKYFQNEDEPFTEVFFVSSTRDVATIDWTMECEENIDLPVSHMTIT